MPATRYTEASFLAALDKIGRKPFLAKVFGERTLATIKDALWFAANEAATEGNIVMEDEGERPDWVDARKKAPLPVDDPDPESADAMAMGG